MTHTYFSHPQPDGLPDFPVPASEPRVARPRLRPPIGIPSREGRGWRGYLVSIVIHLGLLLLILLPILRPTLIEDIIQGAGGPGPAGGGGGGRGGTGAPVHDPERLQYVQTAPPKPPEVKPPVQVPEVTPPPLVVPPIDMKIEAPKQQIDLALAAGVGGGSGRDGTSGNGPGSGGGAGSGVGTGRGSANGPGTGGGPGTIYPPYPIQLILPPIPAPERIKPYCGVAIFDVDETGKVLHVEFTPSKDGGYNKKLKERLNETRFRPATKWDGTPVAAKVQIGIAVSC